MLPSSKNIARNIGIFGGAQAFSVLAAFVRTKAAAVFVGSAGLGLSSMYNTIATFCSTLSGLGLSFGGVKYLSEVFATGDHDKLTETVSKLRGLGMICAVVGVVLTIVLSPLFSLFYYGDMVHLLEFSVLFLLVVATILSGIELAVLKACQKIRYMAYSFIWAALVSVAISVPFYVFAGAEGVLWAVVISGVTETLSSIYFGHKAVATPVSVIYIFKRYSMASLLAGNRPLISLGLAFLAGGLIASGSEIVLQSFFSAQSFSELGLYKAGYQLSISYVGMIFTAVSNDFYPRLSAVSNSIADRNTLIVRQIKVLSMITVPLVGLFIVLVPFLLPLLYDQAFMPVCRMVQIASLSIIVKSVSMPLNYMPLSLGKPKDYLLLEGAFWILLVPLVMIGYNKGGLDGAGWAILICHIIELVYVLAFCRFRYLFLSPKADRL